MYSEDSRIRGRIVFLPTIMKFLAGILLFFAAVLARIVYAVEKDGGVLILDLDNFQQVLNDNQHVFVMFYAKWCYYSKELDPEFAKLPTKLSEMNSTITLGKVDERGQRNLLRRNRVSGFPTLKFFSGDNRLPVVTDGRSRWNSVEYDGDYAVDAMISWLLEQSL